MEVWKGTLVADHPSIHPSIHFLYLLNPIEGCRGLKPFASATAQKAGYTHDRLPVHHFQRPELLEQTVKKKLSPKRFIKNNK